MTHGDFVVTGPLAKLIGINNKLAEVYPRNKDQSWVDRKRHNVEQQRVLERPRRWFTSATQDMWMCLSKDSGLERANTVQTPAADDAVSENLEPLESEQFSTRSQVARCLLRSQDRADITFTVQELCQRMSKPMLQSLDKLKRRDMYLKRERQWRQIFSCGTGDDIFRLRLGRMQGNTEITKRRRDADRRSHVEHPHTHAKDHCEKQRRVACSGGRRI